MSVSGKILKDIIRACVLGAIILCLAVSMGVSGAVRDRTTCTGTEITVLDSAECGFVSEQDVLEYLSEGYGQTAGVPIGNLDLKKMETMLDSRSAILKSEAYCTRDGILHIDITQRKPFMRFQKDGAGFYADEEGYIFPVRPGRSGYVVVIDGHIPLRLDSSRQGKPVSEHSPDQRTGKRGPGPDTARRPGKIHLREAGKDGREIRPDGMLLRHHIACRGERPLQQRGCQIRRTDHLQIDKT